MSGNNSVMTKYKSYITKAPDSNYAVTTLRHRKEEIKTVLRHYKELQKTSGNYYIKKERELLEQYLADIEYALRHLSLLEKQEKQPDPTVDYLAYLRS